MLKWWNNNQLFTFITHSSFVSVIILFNHIYKHIVAITPLLCRNANTEGTSTWDLTITATWLGVQQGRQKQQFTDTKGKRESDTVG